MGASRRWPQSRRSPRRCIGERTRRGTGVPDAEPPCRCEPALPLLRLSRHKRRRSLSSRGQQSMFQRFKSSLNSGRQLGPLEDELMQALWAAGDATVRELVDEAVVDGAYTTIMTTLDRLYKKGLLERSPEGRAFRYRPKQSEAELQQGVVAAGLRELLSASRSKEAPLSFLVETISEHDAALLDELQQAVEKKRRELRKRGPR